MTRGTSDPASSSSPAGTTATAASDSDSSHDPNDPDPGPDVLGIYTGPEADAVLSRSHVLWQEAVGSAKAMPRGEFPSGIFRLDDLLARIPALPNAIPCDASYLEGFSTWENSDIDCPLRKKTEKPHRIGLRALAPLTVTVSTSADFTIWPDTDNNGILLLVLAWSYILNAALAEKLSLPLCTPESQTAPYPSATRMILNLTYTQPQEYEWWRTLINPGTSFKDPLGRFLPWSIVVEDLGILLHGRDSQEPLELPSARRAAEYLARFCSVYHFGHQSSAALAAVLCFRAYRKSGPTALRLPKPRLSPCSTIQPPWVLPCEFQHLSYYMTLSLSLNAVPVLLESIFWEPSVACNHAGQWIRPIRNILGKVIGSGDRELLAKAISFTRTKASPLWLGVLLCGDYRQDLGAMDWYRWSSRTTLDVTAWTGVPRSFLALQPRRQHDTPIPRADVWRLRRDLNHAYETDDYTLEPFGPFCPFGSMERKDIEPELHGHLQCRHRWVYTNWTWKYSVATDPGFHSTGNPFDSVDKPFPGIPGSVSQYVGEYRAPEDAKAVRRVSRISTEWTFKWSGNQVERDFTDNVVPRFRFPEDLQVSRKDSDRNGSTERSVESESAGLMRIREWLADV